MKEKGRVKLKMGNIKEVWGLVNDNPVTMKSLLLLLFHTCLYVTTLDIMHFLPGFHNRHFSLDVLFSLCPL